MQIHIDDSRRCKDIVRHFRARGYLAVERAPGTIEVVPIDAQTREADVARALGDLADWATANEGVAAELLDSGSV